MCWGGTVCLWEAGGDVRSRYADLRASTCRVKTNERGELLRRLLGAHERRPPTKEKDEMQMMKAAVMGRHLGNLSADRLRIPRRQDGGRGRRKQGKKRGRRASERARR